MELSVIISTYNRCQNLRSCIAHLDRQQQVDSLDWEIVVVDNNSTDDTKVTVQNLRPECRFSLRYLFEPEQGLSFARNRGIDDTTSRYLLFIDDDILVDKDWLTAVHATFHTYDCDAVGGRILVDSPESMPAWIQPDMYGFLGHRDFGDQVFKMNGVDEFPFGGNMALHRRAIERVGKFHTGMGRKGDGARREELFKGEETDYFHRLAQAGGSMYYNPDATVHHRILPYQLKKSFFRTIHFNAGYQKAAFDKNFYARTLAGVPLFLFGQFTRAVMRYSAQLFSVGPNTAFRQQMNIGYFLGMIVSYYKHRTAKVGGA